MGGETVATSLEVSSQKLRVKITEAIAVQGGLGWYFGFFFLSGFCSLLYELIWLRLAMAQFGVTTPMVSIVLSSFMAGLGIGSWGAGRFIRK